MELCAVGMKVRLRLWPDIKWLGLVQAPRVGEIKLKAHKDSCMDVRFPIVTHKL